jgi:hypothetical protein
MITLAPLDSLTVDVLTDDVSDNYVSKTLFAVSEFANVILGGASVISGEALLCANLGFGLRLVSKIGDVRRTMLFDTGPEGAIFIRNCANLGIRLGEVECIAVTHGHWDHMAALPATIDAIVKQGGRCMSIRACSTNCHPLAERQNCPGSKMFPSPRNWSSAGRQWSTTRRIVCCWIATFIIAVRFPG